MGKRGSTIGLKQSLLSIYRKNISKRNPPLPFELGFDEFSKLLDSDCYLCGAPPAQTRTRKGKGNQATLFYNGIDRVDNSKGYVVGNVQACCSKCNSVKGSWGLEDLRAHLTKMLKGMGAL